MLGRNAESGEESSPPPTEIGSEDSDYSEKNVIESKIIHNQLVGKDDEEAGSTRRPIRRIKNEKIPEFVKNFQHQ